jgi:hypothetical protein
MKICGMVLVLCLGMFVSVVHGQWPNYPAPGIARSRDGRPDLTADVPRVGGHPDLSGLWQTDGPPAAIAARLFPQGNNGDEIPSQYFMNILFDFADDGPLLPEAISAFRQRAQDPTSISPLARCLPTGLPIADLVPQPFKVLQTPGLIAILYERDTAYRQIFMDGRTRPVDPQPSWLGYSVGHWEGDTLVIESNGFTDRSWLDARGHRHSEALSLTERFRRIDYGHMALTLTIEDPHTFTTPVTIVATQHLRVDTELLESFCNENERDVAHMGIK